MVVRCTGAASSYSLDKACAEQLIEAGCVVISLQTHTIGPAVACENADQLVFHVGYNEDMLDIAPTTSLVSARIDWSPYVLGAVEALLREQPIEACVAASGKGRDLCAGFDRGWVQIVALNPHIAAPETQEKLDRAIEALRRGRIEVFKGEYTGVDPENSADTIDLRRGFTENARSSYPSFHYILDDVIAVEG